MKLGFSRQIFEKFSNMKFYKNSSSGSQLFHVDGQTVLWLLEKLTFFDGLRDSQFLKFCAQWCLFSKV
jgi:hypothetical protein